MSYVQSCIDRDTPKGIVRGGNRSVSNQSLVCIDQFQGDNGRDYKQDV